MLISTRARGRRAAGGAGQHVTVWPLEATAVHWLVALALLRSDALAELRLFAVARLRPTRRRS